MAAAPKGDGAALELDERDALPEPVRQFRRWFAEAADSDVIDHDAMVVATFDPMTGPDARVVLLRGVDEDGFRFFTNYESAKARQLAGDPRTALVFHWREQGRQVRVTGAVRPLDPIETVAYWRNRPRASRISAWASHQSEPIADRASLEAAAARFEARFAGADVPLPPFWGGYLVIPDAVEFWQHGDDRLHDRLRYRREANRWVIERLQP